MIESKTPLLDAQIQQLKAKLARQNRIRTTIEKKILALEIQVAVANSKKVIKAAEPEPEPEPVPEIKAIPIPKNTEPDPESNYPFWS